MTDTRFLASLGGRIKQIRLEKKVPQHKLAALCDFEKASMSRLESGQTNATVLTLRKVCKALNIHMAELFRDFRD
jgi:transcriptional regulator with XRE-family HTH domain